MIDVLYFSTTHCPPCRIIKPQWFKLEEEYRANGSLSFKHYDLHSYEDENGKVLAMQFEIMHVPTFIILKDNDLVAKESGTHGFQIIKDKLKDLINI